MTTPSRVDVFLTTFIWIFAFAASCAHSPPQSVKLETRPQKDAPDSQPEILLNGVLLEYRKFDIPIRVNSAVERWVDYFCGRGRDVFELYLKRSEYFIPFLREILRERKMPEDLVYLAMIESGFNFHAQSNRRAVGLWQFIAPTAKRHGLKISWWVDERRDLKKSTEAAIQYLGDLHRVFDSWELAAAAYNAGEAKVARAIERYQSDDFWTLSRQGYLRAETRNYVPKMIAAALISKNRRQFGFPETYMQEDAEKPIEELDEPEPLPEVLTESEKEETGPEETQETEAAADEAAPESERRPAARLVEDDLGSETKVNSGAKFIQEAPTPHFTGLGETRRERLVEIEVDGPVDLETIGKAAGLSYETIKSLNPELLRWCTPPNEAAYRVKIPKAVQERFLRVYNDPLFPREIQFLTYKVRRGDTVAGIARRFGISPDGVADINRVGRNAFLREERRILLPLPADRSRSLAALGMKENRRRTRRASPKRSRISHQVSATERKAARGWEL